VTVRLSKYFPDTPFLTTARPVRLFSRKLNFEVIVLVIDLDQHACDWVLLVCTFQIRFSGWVIRNEKLSQKNTAVNERFIIYF